MRIFILDDQFIVRKKISKIIIDLALPYASLNEINNEKEFYNSLHTFDILDDDLFFLDIDLNTYFTGIDLAEKIRLKNKNCFIVFITSFDSKGIEVLNRDIFSLGYLLKNQDNSILSSTIHKVMKKANLISRKRHKSERILMFNQFETDILIPEKNIYYIATVPGFKQMLTVKHCNGECMVYGKLSTVKKKLNNEFFFKGMKSYIINMDLLERIIVNEGSLQFANEIFLIVGKTGARKAKNYLKEIGLREI
ncbi:response regulator transcription factor [Enterococcus sp. LJL120]